MFLQLPLSVYAEGHEDRHIGSIPLVMFHADFMNFYRDRMNPRYGPGSTNLRTSFLNTQVNRYYDIPTISAINAFIPMYQVWADRVQWSPFWNATRCVEPWCNPEWNRHNLGSLEDNTMYTLTNYHADSCCHPMQFGHKFLAMVLLYNLEDEMKTMEATNREKWVGSQEEGVPSDFGSFHIAGPLEKFREFWLPTPWRMTKHEDAMYCAHHGVSSFINFMQSPVGGLNLDETVASNEGGAWSFYADSKNKTGFITTTAPSHVALRVTIDAPQNMLKVFHLQTYDGNNSATALVWVDYAAQNGLAETLCNAVDTEFAGKTQIDHHDAAGNTTVFVMNSHRNGGTASVGVDAT